MQSVLTLQRLRERGQCCALARFRVGRSKALQPLFPEELASGVLVAMLHLGALRAGMIAHNGDWVLDARVHGLSRRQVQPGFEFGGGWAKREEEAIERANFLSRVFRQNQRKKIRFRCHGSARDLQKVQNIC